MILRRLVYSEGKAEKKEETFESEIENGIGHNWYIGLNPTPLLIAAIANKDLAIPACPLEFGYHLPGYYALKLAPGLILNGEGGWGFSAGIAISDVAGSWIGNIFELKYSYFDISKFGSSWNVIGSFYKNYQVLTNMILFWGVNAGWGLKGVSLVTSTDSFTGESEVIRRKLEEGFILGLNGGLGFHF